MSCLVTAVSSSSRPTKELSCTGRLLANTSRVRNGGKSTASPARRAGTRAPRARGRGAGAHRDRAARTRRASSRGGAPRWPATRAPGLRGPRSSAAPPCSRRCRSSRRHAARPGRCGCRHGRAARRGCPRFARQSTLYGDGGARPGVGRAERGVHAVARHLHDVALVCGRSASRRISSWRASAALHRVRILLPQARRAFEIRKQESDRPRRQLSHSAPSEARTPPSKPGKPDGRHPQPTRPECRPTERLRRASSRRWACLERTLRRLVETAQHGTLRSAGPAQRQPIAEVSTALGVRWSQSRCAAWLRYSPSEAKLEQEVGASCSESEPGAAWPRYSPVGPQVTARLSLAFTRCSWSGVASTVIALDG